MTVETVDSRRLRDGAAPAGCSPARRVTRSLLGYGLLAGPFYVAVSAGQALTRDGFDLTRHDWSLLADGPGGWVQMANLVLTGAMVVAAAAGLWRAGGRPARWEARLVGGYGWCLVAAGIFRADPMFGFPVGTPDGVPAHPSVHGTLHMIFGGVGFVCLVAACLLSGRRTARRGRHGRALWSRLCGVAVLGGFAATAAAPGRAWATLAFTAGVVVAWAWLAERSLRDFTLDHADGHH